MRILEIKLFGINELSETAKKKAIRENEDINTFFDWWENVYEDAKNVGLKIEGFTLNSVYYSDCVIEFDSIGETSLNTANSILKEHGTECSSYIAAKVFKERYEAIKAHYDESGEYNTDDMETIEWEFKKALQKYYALMLDSEYEYLTSSDAIIETLDCNNYEFLENGTTYKF